MSQTFSLKRFQQQRLSSLLGLSLDGSRLEGVSVRSSGGTLKLEKTLSVTLSLDPLTAAPELVGREIRNHLDAAGIRERYCAVGLPVKWALTAHAEVPDLPPADAASFLQIEAERGFPSDVNTLQVCTSHCRVKGKDFALMVGIPRAHLTALEDVLLAARLKPVAFCPGLMALQRPGKESDPGLLAIAVGESQVGLEVICGGGVAALRTIEGALETEGGRKTLQAEVVAREARITLGQLPPEVREAVRTIRVFGPADLAQQLADELELRLEGFGLAVETVVRNQPGSFGLGLPADAPASPALSVAAEWLSWRRLQCDFLPPRVTAWQQLANRYSSGKLRLAGVVLLALLLGVAGAFAYQQIQLARYAGEWARMAGKVKELETVQERIRVYRPWYDETARALTIMKQVTQAFPEDGIVSAKSVEIRDLSVVTCTGVARDNQALLRTLDRLRAGGSVADLKVNTIRGKSPMQFTFDFRWNEGGKSEN